MPDFSDLVRTISSFVPPKIKTIDEKTVDAIYCYGLYPVLVVLRDLEDQQQFESCALVKKGLLKVILDNKMPFSTDVSDEAMKKTYERIMELRQIPQNVKNNLPNYIEMARKKILTNTTPSEAC